MREFSESVVLNNTYGYNETIGNVECGLEQRFIKYTTGIKSLDDMINRIHGSAGYAEPYPCDGVSIRCNGTMGPDSECSFFNSIIWDNSWINTTCTRFELTDLAKPLICAGSCIQRCV